MCRGGGEITELYTPSVGQGARYEAKQVGRNRDVVTD